MELKNKFVAGCGSNGGGGTGSDGRGEELQVSSDSTVQPPSFSLKLEHQQTPRKGNRMKNHLKLIMTIVMLASFQANANIESSSCKNPLLAKTMKTLKSTGDLYQKKAKVEIIRIKELGPVSKAAKRWAFASSALVSTGAAAGATAGFIVAFEAIGFLGALRQGMNAVLAVKDFASVVYGFQGRIAVDQLASVLAVAAGSTMVGTGLSPFLAGNGPASSEYGAEFRSLSIPKQKALVDDYQSKATSLVQGGLSPDEAAALIVHSSLNLYRAMNYEIIEAVRKDTAHLKNDRWAATQWLRDHTYWTESEEIENEIKIADKTAQNYLAMSAFAQAMLPHIEFLCSMTASKK